MGLSVNERLRAAVVSALQLDGVEQLSADGAIQLSLIVGNLDSTANIPIPRANHSDVSAVAPGAGTIGARSGLLLAGTYDYFVMMDSTDPLLRDAAWRLRDAATTGNIFRHRILQLSTRGIFTFQGCTRVEDGEEIQIINTTAWGAGVTFFSQLMWGRRASS